MATVFTRTLAAACLLALALTFLVAGCGGDGATESPQARPTLTDPASAPTTIPGEDREPYRIGQGDVAAPGDPTPEPATPEPAAGSRTYTVQEGDTCGAVASAHGITLDALLAANPRINEDCTNLRVDEVVNIPAADPADASASDSGGDGGSGSGGGLTYVVVAGDTCAAIADDHALPLQTLLVANGLDEESCQTLQIGQELVIPE